MTDASFKQLVERLERLKQEKAEAAGARDELLRRLKDEFGLNSLKEAKAELERLRKKKAGLLRRADAEFARVSGKWGDKLED